MGRILIGISSWADKTLIESGFYPKTVKNAAGRLSYYAGLFTLAEIDSSYYRMPLASNISLWISSTPASFVFNVKAFRLFTRHPTPAFSIPRSVREKFAGAIPERGNLYVDRLPEHVVNEVWDLFEKAIEPVRAAGKLGVVFFQFPPWFRFADDNLEYLRRCREIASKYRVAVEFRDSSWFEGENEKATLEFLRSEKIALVCVDEPQGFKSSVPPLAEVTAEVAVIRFHGRNRENWEKKGIDTSERFRYYYNREELEEWALKIKEMTGKAGEVHIIFKNKYRDFSARNALQMKEMLGL